jgi:hypothetical protein
MYIYIYIYIGIYIYIYIYVKTMGGSRDGAVLIPVYWGVHMHINNVYIYT